jgi:hypothetical protein
MNGEDDLFAVHTGRLVRDENYRHLLGKNARTLLESTFSVSRAAGQILAHFSQEN